MVLLPAVFYACLLASPQQCEKININVEPAACHLRSYKAERNGTEMRIGVRCEPRPKR